ncbi:hypothetical protein BYT27DRAFT_7196499, partial [Phlegmacium glaucopus]
MSPHPYLTTPQPSEPPKKPGKAKSPSTKALNVFSDDGSFLNRIKRNTINQKGEEDKKKEQEALERKKAFDSRFKNRGKRPLPTSSNPTHTSDVTPDNEEPPSKKVKYSDKSTKQDVKSQGLLRTTF